MKQIVLLFFTFSGIYDGFTQKASVIIVPDSAQTLKKPSVRLFPNPASHKVEIELNGFEPGFVQLQFFDSRGNKVRDDKRLLFNGNETILVMFALEPGIYFLLLKQNYKAVKKKLSIQ